MDLFSINLLNSSHRKENTSLKPRLDNQKALKLGGCWKMEIVFFGLLQIKYMGTQSHMT